MTEKLNFTDNEEDSEQARLWHKFPPTLCPYNTVSLNPHVAKFA